MKSTWKLAILKAECLGAQFEILQEGQSIASPKYTETCTINEGMIIILVKEGKYPLGKVTFPSSLLPSEGHLWLPISSPKESQPITQLHHHIDPPRILINVQSQAPSSNQSFELSDEEEAMQQLDLFQEFSFQRQSSDSFSELSQERTTRESIENKIFNLSQHYEASLKKSRDRENNLLKMLQQKEVQLHKLLLQASTLKSENMTLATQRDQVSEVATRYEAELSANRVVDWEQEVEFLKEQLKISDQRKRKLRQQIEDGVDIEGSDFVLQENRAIQMEIQRLRRELEENAKVRQRELQESEGILSEVESLNEQIENVFTIKAQLQKKLEEFKQTNSQIEQQVSTEKQQRKSLAEQLIRQLDAYEKLENMVLQKQQQLSVSESKTSSQEKITKKNAVIEWENGVLVCIIGNQKFPVKASLTRKGTNSGRVTALISPKKLELPVKKKSGKPVTQRYDHREIPTISPSKRKINQSSAI